MLFNHKSHSGNAGVGFFVEKAFIQSINRTFVYIIESYIHINEAFVYINEDFIQTYSLK